MFPQVCVAMTSLIVLIAPLPLGQFFRFLSPHLVDDNTDLHVEITAHSKSGTKDHPKYVD
jgi:hypothetical protein